MTRHPLQLPQHTAQPGLAALVAAALSAVVYSLTATFTASFHDSAELALRAAQLGATHAPGAPLHTVLGHILTRLLGEPAVATTWLSIVPAALAAAVVGYLVAIWTGGVMLPLLTAMVYALLFPVWQNAIEIELYSLASAAAALALLGAWRWQQAGSPGIPWVLILACAVALAAHFGSILLLPAFGVFLLLVCGVRDPRPWIFGISMVIAIGAIAAANAWLASRVPPFGEYVPLSPAGLLGYMSGAEHEPLGTASSTFYAERLTRHAWIFGRNLLFIGLIAAVVGIFAGWQRNRQYTVLLLLVWLANYGYFTLFGAGDYFLMVGVSYLVAALALGPGLLAITSRQRFIEPSLLAGVVLLSMLIVLGLSKSGQLRVQRSAGVETGFVSESFAALPANSLVIARWNEFTLLHYHQYMDGSRADLTLVVPARRPRHYQHGRVNDYMDLVNQFSCSRPVITNRMTPELEDLFSFEPMAGTTVWRRLRHRDSNACADAPDRTTG